VELVRRLFTLWNNRTAAVPDLAAELFDPDVEWHDQRELPGATVHCGIEEVERHLVAAQEALDYERADLLELLDTDPRVLAGYRIHARGRSSGAPVEREAFHVYSFRGARIERVEIFGTRSEALEAAGCGSKQCRRKKRRDPPRVLALISVTAGA
jgi:ketosteroid isomerase-like protein